MEDEPLVTAKVISEQFHIPRSTLYRLVEDGRLPARDVTQSWHKRKQYRFLVSEVEAKIGRPRRPSPPPPA